MNTELKNNNFLVVRNFISEERSKNLAKEFKKFCKKNPEECSPDTQIPNTPAKYNYISFLELLCEKTPEVSEIIGETVLPTYTYSRIYKKNDVLEKHTDRDACEVSLTVHLDGDKDWEIFVQTPDKKEIPINLNCGDALFYLGCDAPHWREKYTGKSYAQVFLHYVKSRGSRTLSYFDKNKFFEEPKNIQDHIEIIEDIIPKELCDRIISEYSNSDDWVDAEVTSGLDKKVRNCQLINISTLDVISKNELIRKKIDEDIYASVSKIFKILNTKHKHLTVQQDSGYGLLRYFEGGFYTQHTDDAMDFPRTISCSLSLNDDYDGGEFGFFDGKLKYKLKKGSSIVFPSNFLYPHEIMPVTNGVRYSIITWFR